ncbi:MAG TPA: HNH endonuclease signature motif containing protein [Patescibacteria group bacterium]
MKRNIEYGPQEFSPQDKKTLRREHNGCCAFCGERPNPYRENGRRITIHHKVPKSMGGMGNIENGVPLCKPGCHDFFDALAQENGVTYDEYVEDIKRLRVKDRRTSAA